MRLTNRQVADLRTQYAAGGVTMVALAREYGIARPTVSHIVSGKRRRPKPPPPPLPPELHGLFTDTCAEMRYDT